MYQQNSRLSNGVFERKWTLYIIGQWFTLGLIVFIREKKLSNTNLLASRHIKREKALLPVGVRGSKTSLLKLSNRYSDRSESE